MTAQDSIGDKVSWNWENGTAMGEVQEVFTKSVTKTLKGTEVIRNATESEPAHLL